MKVSNTAERLKSIMSERNLKQVDILEKAKPFSTEYDIKLTKVDLSQYLAGKVEPGQAKLFLLANVLNVNEAWLMGYDVPKERQPIIKNHKSFSDEVLYSISILALRSGFKFDFFANQYQISRKDYIVKLSPKEVQDYADTAIKQIEYITNLMLTNKLRDNIVPITKDYLLPQAAHERTDISEDDRTEELRKQEDDIMDDPNF